MKKIQYIVPCVLLSVLLQTSCAQTAKTATDKKPLIVFVAGDHEYSGETTLPMIAAELEKNNVFRTQVIKAHPNQNAEENIPGLEALKDADVAVFFISWRRLTADHVKQI